MIKVGDYDIPKSKMKKTLELAKKKYPNRKIKLEIYFDQKLYEYLLKNPQCGSYPGPIVEILVENLTGEERREFKNYKEKGYYPLGLDYSISKLMDDDEDELEVTVTNYYKL